MKPSARRRAIVRLVVLTVVLCACGCRDPETGTGGDGAWAGTVTTEADVTTVVNESGSVWAGRARLVEELSIGVDQGEEPYMFGRIISLTASEGRIYVADYQVPAVRVFDSAGRYVRDIGRPGQGPGEYEEPSAVSVLPDGRVLVRDYSPGQRTNVFGPDGEALDAWYGDPSFGTDAQPVVTYEGEYYTQTYGATQAERRQRRPGMGRAGPDGIEGEVLRYPRIESPQGPMLTVSGKTTTLQFGVPFSPRVARRMLPSRTMVAGLTSEYRLIADRPDGSRLVIARTLEPIPLGDEEWDWHRRRVVASARGYDPGFEWDGAGLSREHDVFVTIHGDRARRIWVRRAAAVKRVAECTEEPLSVPHEEIVACWETEYVVDVFDEGNGKLLGEVEIPDGLVLSPSSFGSDVVWATMEDDSGTIRVKRYRLVLP